MNYSIVVHKGILSILIVLLLTSCANQEITVDNDASSEQATLSERSQPMESNATVPNSATEIQIPSMSDWTEISEYIKGLTIFQFKDGEYDLFDITSDYDICTHWLGGLNLHSFSAGTALVTYAQGGYGVEALLLSQSGSKTAITSLPNLMNGSLPQMFSNGLVAVCDETIGQQIELLTPTGERADTQLAFDYGKELTAHKEADFPFNYNTLGYERCAEAITYDEGQNRYIMVFTNSAWLEYEKDTSLKPCEIGVAIFDEQGNQTDLFMLKTDENFHITYLSKGYSVYGSSKLIYISDNTVLLVGYEGPYCTIDLNTGQLHKIAWEQAEEILNKHGMTANRAPHKITYKQSPCPLKLFSTSDGISICSDDEGVITELKGRYTPFGYAVDTDGTCYIYLVNHRFKTEEVQPVLDDEQSHIVLNARFKFSVKIPDSWNAVDRSANGDGYFIECDNPNIDIRVYGYNGLYGPDYNSDLNIPFGLDSGVTGWIKETPGESITFTYCSNDRTVEMYVSYEGEDNWYEDNMETVFMIARSLHDTD